MARSSALSSERGEASSHLMPTEMMTIDRISTATALVSGLAAKLTAILSNDTDKTWHPVAGHGRHEKEQQYS
jgi:hypothetical protein